MAELPSSASNLSTSNQSLPSGYAQTQHSPGTAQNDPFDASTGTRVVVGEVSEQDAPCWGKYCRVPKPAPPIKEYLLAEHDLLSICCWHHTYARRQYPRYTTARRLVFLLMSFLFSYAFVSAFNEKLEQARNRCHWERYCMKQCHRDFPTALNSAWGSSYPGFNPLMPVDGEAYTFGAKNQSACQLVSPPAWLDFPSARTFAYPKPNGGSHGYRQCSRLVDAQRRYARVSDSDDSMCIKTLGGCKDAGVRRDGCVPDAAVCLPACRNTTAFPKDIYSEACCGGKGCNVKGPPLCTAQQLAEGLDKELVCFTAATDPWSGGFKGCTGEGFWDQMWNEHGNSMLVVTPVLIIYSLMFVLLLRNGARGPCQRKGRCQIAPVCCAVGPQYIPHGRVYGHYRRFLGDKLKAYKAQQRGRRFQNVEPAAAHIHRVDASDDPHLLRRDRWLPFFETLYDTAHILDGDDAPPEGTRVMTDEFGSVPLFTGTSFDLEIRDETSHIGQEVPSPTTGGLCSWITIDKKCELPWEMGWADIVFLLITSSVAVSALNSMVKAAQDSNDNDESEFTDREYGTNSTALAATFVAWLFWSMLGQVLMIALRYYLCCCVYQVYRREQQQGVTASDHKDSAHDKYLPPALADKVESSDTKDSA